MCGTCLEFMVSPAVSGVTDAPDVLSCMRYSITPDACLALAVTC